MRFIGPAIVLLSLVLAGCQEPPEGPSSPPENPDQLLERMAAELSEDDRVLHLQTEMVAEPPDGEPQELASFEAWFDFDDEQGRFEFARGADNQGEAAESSTFWFEGQYRYHVAPPRRSAVGESMACLDVAPHMVEQVACGFSFITGNLEATDVRLLGETSWEGEDAIGIAFEHVREVPERLSPPDTPTPTPLPATPTVAPELVTFRTSYEFYVDPDTYLPLGVRAEHERDGVAMDQVVYDYDVELLAPADFDRSILDPRAAGYRTDEEQEMELLDQVTREAAVYWLGRSTDVGSGVGNVQLERVELRNHPQRPALLTLDYGTREEGRLRIEVWQEGEWGEFLGRLDEAGQGNGNFVYASDCRETTDTTVSGNDVRILARHDVQPAANAPPTPQGGYEQTPAGQDQWTTPTPTRAPDESCPPRDTYMAEVHIDDYVITLNAPTGVWGPDGRFGMFNSPEALQAVAAELKRRQLDE